MRHSLLATVLAFTCSAAVSAPSEEVAALAAQIETRLQSARYMEGTCTPMTLAGWEGYETRRCSYEVTDKKTSKVKSGLVVMLNPSAIKLSEWIISACRNVRPTQKLPTCTKQLFERILVQSGGQFPVAGIVYEDIIPADGINEAYGFRDGVTTILTGVKHRGTEPLSAQELEGAITAEPLQTASDNAFARIAGVTRSEFRKANPAASIAGLSWLATVRTEYQKAWNSSRNSLVEAWLASSPL